VRSLTDGHIHLTRRLAEQAHFPAIDVLSSVSRVRSRVTSKEQQNNVNEMTRILAAYRDAEDLIQIGAYVKGKNRDVDRAIERMPQIRDYLCQDRFEDANLDSSARGLAEILAESNRRG
jgi:flagellum-specific ATP synthase